MRSKKTLLLALIGALAGIEAMAQTNVDSLNAVSHLDSSEPMPKFQEVYQILSTNLEGVNANELNRLAVRGLVGQLGRSISLTGEDRSSKAAPLADARVFDNSFAYFRVAFVSSNLPEAFRAAYKQMTETNKSKIKGLVLDLRFANGFDYSAAAKLADCFLSSDHALLDWQTGSAHASLKADAITIPVAILINSETAGAAEALAAVLRDSEVGLILGSQTAGQASIFKEFPLSEGGKLRVAVAPVKFGAGKTLLQGVTPDIAIDTSLEDERAYLQDPFKVLHPPVVAKAESASKPVLEQPRMNEVELIREHNNGEDRPESYGRDRPEVTEQAPVIADPVLARALDLLKGLAVVQPNRPG
jgi:hypothetical protein